MVEKTLLCHAPPGSQQTTPEAVHMCWSIQPSTPPSHALNTKTAATPPLFCPAIPPSHQQKSNTTRSSLQRDMISLSSMTSDMHNGYPPCCHHQKATAVLSAYTALGRNATSPHHLWIGSSTFQLHWHIKECNIREKCPGPHK